MLSLHVKKKYFNCLVFSTSCTCNLNYKNRFTESESRSMQKLCDKTKNVLSRRVCRCLVQAEARKPCFFVSDLRCSCREHAWQPAMSSGFRFSSVGPLWLHHFRDYKWGLECGGPAQWLRLGSLIYSAVVDTDRVFCRLLSWFFNLISATGLNPFLHPCVCVCKHAYLC